MEKEILRLFKGYYSNDKDLISEGFSEEALKYGLIIELPCDDKIIEEAIKQYGKNGQDWNQTFHKDFEIVRNAPIEDLIQQQLMHYVTTYGFESLGIYDSEMVYIPKEKLEIPELDKDIEMVVIHPLSDEELTEKLMILLTSGIALSEQTVKDIMVLSNFIDKNRFDEIKNREIKTALYDKYNIMPKNSDEFLRYLLFKTTGDTLKIQNKKMIDSIKEASKQESLKMINSYIEKNSIEKLSSIFLRNKNLFLAFKINKNDSHNQNIRKEMNSIINKLRKLAVKNHKPLPKNILDCLTNKDYPVNLTELPKILDDVTIFREIRILNSILYRINGNNNIVYKIRNGKSYVNKLENKDAKYIGKLKEIESVIKEHLINRLSKQVKGKTIYIPDNVTYSAPTSEKQFNGNFPEGSYIEVPRTDDMIYGIHWKNIMTNKQNTHSFYGFDVLPNGEERVDLDLKQMNKNEVFGWDASYRSSTSDILFSGDMTNAPSPNGATELFYVGQNYGQGAFLVTLNMYTSNSQDVPFEFVIAKSTNNVNIRENYVIDPNNILEKINIAIKKDERQMIVGFITIGDTIRFYFNDFSAGSVRSSKQNDITMGSFDYLQSYSKIQLKLNDLLVEAGAIISNTSEIEKEIPVENDEGKELFEKIKIPVDIDLSPNAITKESLIKLLSESDN